ncbi:diguanylate cyclase (GGDEF) domain-containing protein [Allopseudospirillum japonicum]|uniref:diguanylate cyclase n=1 Tax=Allopseudospirillum japonicum TaxID=64971 RepID=A0A1H6R947_9GAMM|nr:diguanylate cyclase (GGDEF) domain-containing protein [Allopseudospirillum japonicum]
MLKQLSNLVSGLITKDDVLGRWGGEEFILYVNQALCAPQLAERIRMQVATHAFTQIPKLTLSLGVAKAQTYPSLDKALLAVDAVLYQAKDQGRNQVCVLSNDFQCRI